MGGQGGAAAGAVGDNLKSLVEKTLIPDLLKRPPLRLDECVVVGYVGMIHIGPEAHGVGEILPHALVLPDALLAVLDKRLQTVLLDLLLAVQAHLLHFQLHRKSVSVPACFSGNHVSLHSPVSGDHILDHAGENVADVGLAVGCGRPVVEHVGSSLGPRLNTLLKNVVVSPELFNFLLSVHKIEIRGYFVVHNFPPYSFCGTDSRLRETVF